MTTKENGPAHRANGGQGQTAKPSHGSYSPTTDTEKPEIETRLDAALDAGLINDDGRHVDDGYFGWADPPEGFEFSDGAVHAILKNRYSEPYSVKIAGRLWVSAHKAGEGGELFIEVAFVDNDGKTRRVDIPRGDLAYPDSVARKLLQDGTDVDPVNSKHLVRFLANSNPVTRLVKESPDNFKSTADDWPEPIALDAVKLPVLSGDIFTGWLGDMVDGVSASTETPRELAASFGLAVLGGVAQGKFCVMPEGGYVELASIWTITALESGNRKSAVMQAMTRPLAEWERDQADQLKPEIERLSSERKTQEARISRLRSEASRLEGDEFRIAQAEIAELEAELPVIPIAPRLWIQDVTPERLGVVMAEQNERIGLLSDEGGIFDTLAGRYSGGIPNLDLFLQGHSGSPVRVDRQGRDPIYMNSPALTMGLSPQPEVIRRLADNSSFRGRGLLARFLYFLPSSPLGRRTLEARSLPENVESEYDRAIRRLLDLQPAIGDDGRPRPHILKFSTEAHAEWKTMARYVEKELRDGGQFEHIKDWGGKLPGACARLAGLLHVAEHAFDEPWRHEISGDTMNRALNLGAIFSKHALAVFDLIGADESLDAARKVWRWIERTRVESFSARDVFHALQRTFHNMEAMEPGLRVLIERGVIRELEGERRPGRPSRKFAVNPRIVEGWL